MNYKELYKEKLTDIEGALNIIKDNDFIVGGSVGVEPVAILSHMHTLCGKVNNIHFMNGLGMRNYPFINEEQYQETFTNECVFLMKPGREAHGKQLLNFLPGHLHNANIRWLKEKNNGILNVCIVAATPMDEFGYFRVSLSLIQERWLMDHAEKIIVEVNSNIPLVYGETEIHITDVDCIVEAKSDLPILEKADVKETEKTIGGYISALVKDGDCIQLGIGGIPDAAADALMGKHDLGIHTEMITNSMVDLVEAGVITGKKKNLHKGKIVGAFALGNQRLYDFLDNNPSVVMLRGNYVNNPVNISKNDNFTSINTCISVDLGGQICSESIGSRQYSGSGGQADTAVGALHSRGGKNIIALTSTKKTKRGIVSGINAQLPLGSVVTLGRNDVDYIVTEYGIAPMRGRSIRERVNNLIAIAHPDYRGELRKEAFRCMLW